MESDICFFASKVSALCGRNKYVSQEEAISEFLGTSSRSTMLNNFVSRSQDGETEDSIATTEVDDDGRKIKYVISVVDDENKHHSSEKDDEIIQISPEKMEERRTIAYQSTSCARGIREESNILSNLDLDYKIDKSILEKRLNINVILVGRVDGYQVKDGENTHVLEVKTRRKHLFYNIPDYELDQMACYAFLSDLPVKLIQYYNGKTRINEFSYEFLMNRMEELRCRLMDVSQIIRERKQI
jgi:hypothetical protein